MEAKIKATLFTKTDCAECIKIDHETLTEICTLDIANCDIEDEHNMARAIVNDVMNFPTLVIEDGKHYAGVDEILVWIQNQKSS